MLRFLHFEIGALDRQARDELLSPFSKPSPRPRVQLQNDRHVFYPRKRFKFNGHGMPYFLVGDKGLALGQLLAAKESACRNAVPANACSEMEDVL